MKFRQTYNMILASINFVALKTAHFEMSRIMKRYVLLFIYREYQLVGKKCTISSLLLVQVLRIDIFHACLLLRTVLLVNDIWRVFVLLPSLKYFIISYITTYCWFKKNLNLLSLLHTYRAPYWCRFYLNIDGHSYTLADSLLHICISALHICIVCGSCFRSCHCYLQQWNIIRICMVSEPVSLLSLHPSYFKNIDGCCY